jgi:uncharacterized membrane protein YgdD (TMEM256/DUF423 family)
MTPRVSLLLGMFFAGLAVALGAFGAHALETRLPMWYLDPAVAMKMQSTWEVAVRYQLAHALALVMLGIWGDQHRERKVSGVTFLFTVGILLFSGLLYLLVLTGIRVLGAIVPVGGSLLILGWLWWGGLICRPSLEASHAEERIAK